MSYSACDLADSVEGYLREAGYTFHDNDSEVHALQGPGCIDESIGHWFCWTDGKVDVEVGETRDNGLAAQADALAHLVARTRSYHAGLVELSRGPEVAPDDTEGAETYGYAMAEFEAAQLARRALRGELPAPLEEEQPAT